MLPYSNNCNGVQATSECNPFGVARFLGTVIIRSVHDPLTLFLSRTARPTTSCPGPAFPDEPFNITVTSEVVKTNPFIPQTTLSNLPFVSAVPGQDFALKSRTVSALLATNWTTFDLLGAGIVNSVRALLHVTMVCIGSQL
jgi:hypothetical protein